MPARGLVTTACPAVVQRRVCQKIWAASVSMGAPPLSRFSALRRRRSTPVRSRRCTRYDKEVSKVADTSKRLEWTDEDTYWRTNYRNRPYASTAGREYDYYQ